MIDNDLGRAIQGLIDANIANLHGAFLAEVVKVNQNSVDVRALISANKDDKQPTIYSAIVCQMHNDKRGAFVTIEKGDKGLCVTLKHDASVYKTSGQGGIAQDKSLFDLKNAVFLPLSGFNQQKLADDAGVEFKEQKNKLVIKKDKLQLIFAESDSTSELNINKDLIELKDKNNNALTITKDKGVFKRGESQLELMQNKAKITDSAGEISINSGLCTIKSNAANLKDILDELITTLSSAMTIPAVVGTPLTLNPDVIAKLTALKAKVATLLK